MNWTYLASNVVAQLVLAPFLIERLHQARYGVWATIGSLLNYLMLLDLGVTSAVNRFVARYRMLDDHQRMNQVVSGAAAIFAVVALTLAAASLLIAKPFLAFFPLIPPEARAESALALQLVCVGAGVRLLHVPFLGLFQGWQLHAINNAVLIAMVVIRLGLTIGLCIGWRATVDVPALTFVIASAVGLLSHVVISRWRFPWLRFWPTHTSAAAVRELMGLGSHVFLIAIGGMTIYQGSNFILTRMVGPEAVTPFSLGMLVIVTCQQALDGISTLFTPLISSMEAASPSRSLGPMIVRGCQVLGVLAWGICMALLVAGKPFMHLWLVPRTSSDEIALTQALRTAGEAYVVLAILLGAMCVTWPNMAIHNALLGVNRAGWLAIGYIAAAVGIVFTVVILVRSTGLAGVAAAAGIAGPFLLLQLFWLPSLLRRFFQEPLGPFAWRAHLRPMLVAAAVGLPALWIREHLAIDSWFSLVVFCAAMCAAYAAAAFWISVDSATRGMLLGALRPGAVRS